MFSIAYGWKLLGQALFIFAGIVCLKQGEAEVGKALIYSTIGSMVPVAEQHRKKV